MRGNFVSSYLLITFSSGNKISIRTSQKSQQFWKNTLFTYLCIFITFFFFFKRLCEWVLHDFEDREIFLEKLLHKIEPTRLVNWRQLSEDLVTMFEGCEGKICKSISDWVKTVDEHRDITPPIEQNRYYESVIKVIFDLHSD